MQQNTPAALVPGTIFQRYLIVKTIGCGGMASIFEAVQINRRRRVALKVLHPAFATNKEARGRFLREGEAASRMSHPHIVDVSEVGVHEGVPYMVMEFLEGENLADLMDRVGAIEPTAAVDLLLPIVSAVAAAHEAGVIHRDLKPHNIFLAEAGESGAVVPKLLDFGVSKVLCSTNTRVLTGGAELVGTPYYMSPEQARGNTSAADARSDQYSLGVILYECVAGRGPFDDDGMYALISAVVEGRFVPPSTYRGGLPDALEAVILRAMSHAPEDRFGSVQELGRALLPFASSAVQLMFEDVFGRSTMPDGAARAQQNRAHAETARQLPAAMVPPRPPSVAPPAPLADAARPANDAVPGPEKSGLVRVGDLPRPGADADPPTEPNARLNGSRLTCQGFAMWLVS